MGIEPTKPYLYKASPILKTADDESQPTSTPIVSDSVPIDWRAYWRKAWPDAPEMANGLADVLTAWASLPESIRASITALIRASNRSE